MRVLLNNRALLVRRIRLLVGTLGLLTICGCSPLDSMTGTSSGSSTDQDSEADGAIDDHIASSLPMVDSSWGTAAELERVIDGDSLELRVDGEIVEVRLPGFNAPELYREGNSKTCQGEKAREVLEQMFQTGEVRFLAQEQDRYGRTLGSVAVDGQLVIEHLIVNGWGLATANETFQRDLMKDAAGDRRGIWGDGCGDPASPDAFVGATHVDADGNDRSNMNDEWVEIGNRGTEPIDLTGWVIRDETYGHRFALAGMLGADASLRIRSGQGNNSSTELYLGERYPVWSNSGETVVLVDPEGVFVDWLFID